MVSNQVVAVGTVCPRCGHQPFSEAIAHLPALCLLQLSCFDLLTILTLQIIEPSPLIISIAFLSFLLVLLFAVINLPNKKSHCKQCVTFEKENCTPVEFAENAQGAYLNQRTKDFTRIGEFAGDVEQLVGCWT